MLVLWHMASYRAFSSSTVRRRSSKYSRARAAGNFPHMRQVPEHITTEAAVNEI